MNTYEAAPWGGYGARNLSEDGYRCRLLSEAQIGRSKVAPAQKGFAAGCGRRPQQDSNLRTRLRRPMLYPLSYGGSVPWKGYQ